MPEQRHAPGHYDGDGCTFPAPGHFLPEGLGYSMEVEGPVYQQDAAGQLRRIDGADLDPARTFYWIPDEADHEQGDEPAELGPEWVSMGYVDAERDGDPGAKARSDWLNGLPPLTDVEARQLVDRKGPHRWMAKEPPRPLR